MCFTLIRWLDGQLTGIMPGQATADRRLADQIG